MEVLSELHFVGSLHGIVVSGVSHFAMISMQRPKKCPYLLRSLPTPAPTTHTRQVWDLTMFPLFGVGLPCNASVPNMTSLPNVVKSVSTGCLGCFHSALASANI